MHRASCAPISIAVAITLAACGQSAAGPVGAVRVHTEIDDALLYVDAREYGPLRDGMELELSAGQHTIEARRLGAMVAFLSVDVRAALIFDATLRPPATPVFDQPRDVVVPSAAPVAEPSAEPAPDVDPALAASPSRTELVAVMRALQPAILACTTGTHGRFTLRISFASSGEPNTVSVSGGDLEPMQRPCILEAARTLRVAPFEPRDFIVNYPYTY